MGKASRLRKQRKAAVAKKFERGTIVPIPMEKALSSPMGTSYWVTGYFWQHDVVIVEPFCVVVEFGRFKITNLSTSDIDYFEAVKLLKEGKNLTILEDRVHALDVCQAFHNEKELLDGMSEFMSEEQLSEFANSRIGE